jgi:hypothetical protein
VGEQFKIGLVIPFSNGLVTSTGQRVHGNNGQVTSMDLDSMMVRKTKVIFTWNVLIEVCVIVKLENANVSMDTLVLGAIVWHALKVALVMVPVKL